MFFDNLCSPLLYNGESRLLIKSDIRQNPLSSTAYVHLSTLHSGCSESFTESKPFLTA
ncbi:MAG: hypothetical protein RSF13_03425 [Clostridiales bacterium]